MESFISCEALTGFHELVAELGGSPQEMLADTGIDASAIAPGGKLPFSRVGNLLESCARSLRCSDFGMRLGERQFGPQNRKALHAILVSAPTLGSATQCAIHYMDTYSSALREKLEYDESQGLFAQRIDFRADVTTQFPQITELLLLLVHTSTVLLTGGAAHARQIWFTHRQISAISTYRARFGTSPRFLQEFNATFLTEHDIRSPIIGGDKQRFVAANEALNLALPRRAQNIELELKDALADLIPAGTFSCEDAADYLGVSTRTLHRKLRSAGTSFELMRDDVRRLLAARYLSRQEMPLTEVAAKVGYSELAVLVRSCHRWFGTTPKALRRNQANDTVRTAPASPAAEPRHHTGSTQ